MDCFEVQALIPRYIEGDLSTDELIAFIKHIEECKECRDELEIYYIVVIGIKQLDGSDNTSYNIEKELKDRLESTKKYVRRRFFLEESYNVIFAVAITVQVITFFVLFRYLI